MDVHMYNVMRSMARLNLNVLCSEHLVRCACFCARNYQDNYVGWDTYFPLSKVYSNMLLLVQYCCTSAAFSVPNPDIRGPTPEKGLQLIAV